MDIKCNIASIIILISITLLKFAQKITDDIIKKIALKF